MIEQLQRVIGSLKTLDVRGFDSMDTLVGCVISLESMVTQLEAKRNAQTTENAE